MIFLKFPPLLLSIFLPLQVTLGVVVFTLSDFRGENNKKLLRGLWARIDSPTDLDNDSLTRQAAAAMEVAQTRSNAQYRPNALTAMTPDRRTIYLFSSHKGSASPADPANTEALDIQAPVPAAVQRCIAKYGQPGHGNGARCGEIMSTNEWFKENAGQTMQPWKL